MSEEVFIRRLLLTLWGARQEATSLQSCIDLANRLEVGLEALFVEDERLLRAGRLPFAWEVGQTSARIRSLSGAGIESSLHAAAERARQALETAAGRSAMPFTFRIARGRPVAAALAAAQAMDVVILAGGQLLARRPPHRRAATQPPMLAILAPDPSLTRQFGAACRLARAVGAELIVALPAVSEGEFMRLRGELEGLPAASRVPVRYYRLRGLDAAASIGAARSFHAGLVSVPGTLAPELLDALVDGLRCPLLLLGR